MLHIQLGFTLFTILKLINIFTGKKDPTASRSTNGSLCIPFYHIRKVALINIYRKKFTFVKSLRGPSKGSEEIELVSIRLESKSGKVVFCNWSQILLELLLFIFLYYWTLTPLKIRWKMFPRIGLYFNGYISAVFMRWWAFHWFWYYGKLLSLSATSLPVSESTSCFMQPFNSEIWCCVLRL